MRDYRKFCMPKTTNNPKSGDVQITLNCGKQVYVEASEFEKVKEFFKNYTIVPNKPRPLRVGNYDYVEIGGLLWATKNIGALSETDSGLYFAWGEITGYTADLVGVDKEFDWSDYRFTVENYDVNDPQVTKYPEDDYILDLEDDAAHVNMGENWRMPTYHEIKSLEENTTLEYVTDYKGSGVNGLLLTSLEDSSIKLFFPSAGIASFGNISTTNSLANYWTSVSSSATQSADLYFNANDVDFDHTQVRCSGLTIRGVIDPNEQ